MTKTSSLHFIVATAIGLLAVVVLVVHQGVTQIVGILGTAGWGLGLVCLSYLPPLLISSLAWHAILRRFWPRVFRTFLLARWVRESVDTPLPVTQIGGAVVGARLLTFSGASASLGCASVVVDLTLEALTQFVFTTLRIVLLVASGHYDGTVRAVIAGLHGTIQELYRDRRGILLSSGFHLLSWIRTSAEVWLALFLMGHPASLGEAIVFLSLAHAARSAAFLVPSGLGAQKASFMVLAAMYGMPTSVSLVVSLAIRLREIVLGAPGLVV